MYLEIHGRVVHNIHGYIRLISDGEFGFESRFFWDFPELVEALYEALKDKFVLFELQEVTRHALLYETKFRNFDTNRGLGVFATLHGDPERAKALDEFCQLLAKDRPNRIGDEPKEESRSRGLLQATADILGLAITFGEYNGLDGAKRQDDSHDKAIKLCHLLTKRLLKGVLKNWYDYTDTNSFTSKINRLAFGQEMPSRDLASIPDGTLYPLWLYLTGENDLLIQWQEENKYK